MKFQKTAIEGVVLVEPDVHADARGEFFESYRRDVFAANGIGAEFIQDNHSVSKKGVLRGLHYQIAPAAQGKLVRVTRGAAFDVVVDIRRASPTFGKCSVNELSAANRRLLYVPPGFAHGFLALEDGTEFLYKVSATHSAAHERGISWSDPALGIPWPKLGGPPVISEKDARHPALADAKDLF